MALPPSLHAADDALHELLRTVAFSPHLNPTNIDEARNVFFAGAPEPPFTYAPLPDVSGLLARLDAIRPPLDHPLGVEVARAVDEVRALTRALAERSGAAFHALNVRAGYYAEAAEPPAPALPLGGGESGSATWPADRMYDVLRAALDVRGLTDWRIERDPVMSARVLVDSAKRLLRLNPGAWFRELDLRTLVAHEIDVHALRARNGAAQPLHLFQDGLAGTLLTEEGLALCAELRVGGLGAGFLDRQQLFLDAVALAHEAGFRDVYTALLARVPPSVAWGLTLRVKRGLAQPGLPGVYAKDTVYARGFRAVHAWLAAGGDVARLYVGKVGLAHPVDAWVAEGWLTPAAAPPLWTDGVA